MPVFLTSISFLVRKVDLVDTFRRSKVKNVNGKNKTLNEKTRILKQNQFLTKLFKIVVIQT